jgi:large subunit ribosomal protein L23
MAARDIIIRPIVTEKTQKLAAENKVTFEVDKNANKSAIALAIKEIYGVKPLYVHTLIVKPKKKRVGKYVGKTKTIKKAIIKFAEGEMIDVYNFE